MKAIVVGGSGYTGAELLRLLKGHPDIDGITVTSRQYAGQSISKIHSNLVGIMDEKFIDYNPEDIDADIAFLALPHGTSMDFAPALLERGIKVVDMSADFRIKDQKLYESYYVKHKALDLLQDSVYGLPELFKKEISGAKLVANPGCYASAAILSLAPAVMNSELFDLEHIIVDSKSGTSGAGVNPTTFTHHSEVFDNLKPYKVTGHRHEPEINHILSTIGGKLKVHFTPTLIPIVRGILSNAHIFEKEQIPDPAKLWMDFYKDCPFIRIVETACTKNVLYSNYADISLHQSGGRHVIICAIDNLIKGAAGVAVQNMNLMFGLEQTQGLQAIPFHP